MQNTKNQARGSGIHARHNPTNDKTVSGDLQNASGNIVAPTRYRLTKLGEQMARLPIDPKIPRIFYGVPFWEMPDLLDIDDRFQELVVA